MTPAPDPPAPRGSTRFVWLALVALIAALGVGWAIGKLRTSAVRTASAPVETDTNSGVGRGELLFATYCVSCHGPDGKGDGPSGITLRPPPRDFAERPWRFAVTKESIRQVIREGIAGTAMPSYRAALTLGDVDALVDYVLSLASVRPPRARESSADQELLQAAGFIDLRGMNPPELLLGDAAGKELKLADLKGRLVLIHFWGANCLHCLKEMPALKKLETSLMDRPFSVLRVCADCDDVKDAQLLADRTAPGQRVFTEESGLGLAKFEVHTLPTVWLIAPNGQAIGRAHGSRDWGDANLRRLLDRWLPTRDGKP